VILQAHAGGVITCDSAKGVPAKTRRPALTPGGLPLPAVGEDECFQVSFQCKYCSRLHCGGDINYHLEYTSSFHTTHIMH
jgi:hypothetical protein